jgi:HD-GYP domain-containing protein (c-di-GMP phosphodiesterase class II)
MIVSSETTLEQALGQADQRLYNNKRSSRTRESGEAHDVLLRVLAENSASLATHLSNVGRLAEAVARQLGLSDDEVTLTRLTAELHDIGKTAIPDAILDKPGTLDADEWEFMRRHTLIGERILAAAPALARIAPLVRATHERADGAGYPDGLRAEEIPLSSRVVAVVDAYDAMTSKRAYSLPLTPNEAIDELRRCAGTQFDTTVTEAFIAVWQEGVRAMTVQGSTAASSIAA